MKSLISRESHRPKKRYSGVYHVQGGMVTDADLDERSRITQERTDNLGIDTVHDGVPQEGGAVARTNDGSFALQEGVIYADGVRGTLMVRKRELLEGPLDLFNKQADFPLAPELINNREQIIYADIWDRPVHALEEPYLADAGLHGAITTFRTRTMTQLKSAALSEELFKQHETNEGVFRKIGTGNASVTQLNAEILADDCDPCADVVSAEQQISNALWRLEVIDVQQNPERADVITLAWSVENASTIAPASVSAESFELTNKVYEYYSEITESHLGVMEVSSNAKRSAFVDDLDTTPTPPTDHNGEDWPWLRRWDGQAVIDLVGSSVDSKLGGGFEIGVSDRTIKLRVEAFELELDLKDKAVLAGDYWLVELRRFADQENRVNLVSREPFGVVHHYCTLFRVSRDSKVLEPTDEETRKLSFPALSNLPADHVGFNNTCMKLFDDAENVQEALDNLCDISAGDIGFEPGCELFEGAKTVQEALDSLCKIDFSVHESFRHLFDWGVVCGIIPQLLEGNSGLVSISAGTYLDRSGRLVKFMGREFDLSKLEFDKSIFFESASQLSNQLAEGGVCLALAANKNGETAIFVVPEALAYGPDDPGFLENARKCLEEKQIIDLKANVGKLKVNPRRTVNRVIFNASKNNAFRGSAKLTTAQAQEARTFNNTLAVQYAKVATGEEVVRLNQRMEKAVKENPIGNTQGAAREIREMRQATAVFRAFAISDEERMRRCICASVFPTCPPGLGEEPYFLPIACLKGKYDDQTFFLTEVCAFCCRKQAMTWRSLQYYIGPNREALARQLAAVCCGDEQTDQRFNPGIKYDPGKYKDISPQRIFQDYRLFEAFADEKRRALTDYRLEVDINDLNEEEAKKTLIGSGLVIAGTFDVDDEKAFDKIEEKSVGINSIDQFISAETVKPGDKVGLLLQDGTARGYVLLEKGSGKLPFEQTKAKLSIDITNEDQVKAAKLIEQTDEAKKELKDLTSLRDTLSSDVNTLKTNIDDLSIQKLKTQFGELENLRDRMITDLKEANEDRRSIAIETKNVQEDLSKLTGRHTTLSHEVKELSSEVGQLEGLRNALSDEVSKMGDEMKKANEHLQVLQVTVREQQPIIALLGKQGSALANKLAGEKILTVADLAGLNSTRIQELVQARIIKLRDANKLGVMAQDFIKTGQ